MSLQFTPPPDWLIENYVNRKSPIEGALDAGAQIANSYTQNKALQQQKQNEALKGYIDAFGVGGPGLAGQVAQRNGLKNPPSFPGVTAAQVPSGGTAGVAYDPGTSSVPTSAENAAQQSLPDQHPANAQLSPIIQASLAAGHPNHAGLTLPGNPDPLALAGMGGYGAKQLTTLESVQKLQDAQTAAKDKAEENGPKSFDYARTFASNAKSPEAADGFIRIAQAEGRNTLTKREMSDLKDSINVSAQKGRGDYFEGSLNLKTQQMRDALIKEARTTLDPYFQTGAGKLQAARLLNIGRAETLINQMKTQSLSGDTRQMRESATQLAAILTNSNVLAQNQIEELLPQTYKGKLLNFVEKFRNEPTGLDQQAFVDRFADTIGREKQVVLKQTREVADRTAPTLRVLKSQFPDDYTSVINQYMQHSPEIIGPAPGAGAPASTGPHGPEITQKGITYKWNGTAYE